MPVPMQTYSISNPELSHVLKSEEPISPVLEVDLSHTFGEILRRANGFVPRRNGNHLPTR